MKSRALVLFFITLVFTVSCKKEKTIINTPVQVRSISLNIEKLTLKEDADQQLSATIFPTDAKDKKVIWTSSDTTIATVDSIGKVKAVSAGSTLIKASSANGVLSSCLITVQGVKTLLDISMYVADSGYGYDKVYYKVVNNTLSPVQIYAYHFQAYGAVGNSNNEHTIQSGETFIDDLAENHFNWAASAKLYLSLYSRRKGYTATVTLNSCTIR